MRNLATSRGCFGFQPAVAVTADDSLVHGPAQSVQGVTAGCVCVREVQQEVGRDRETGVPPKYDGQLLPGDGVIGAKASAAITAYDSLRCRPSNGVGVPRAGRCVGEGAAVLDDGPSGVIVEDLYQLSTGKVVVRPEQTFTVTAHQTVFADKPDRLIVPCAGCHIGIGVVPHGRGKGGCHRHGPAGHGEGVFAVALIGQLDSVPPAVGDGQSIQRIAAVRGNGQGDGTAAGGVGTAGHHLAITK